MNNISVLPGRFAGAISYGAKTFYNAVKNLISKIASSTIVTKILSKIPAPLKSLLLGVAIGFTAYGIICGFKKCFSKKTDKSDTEKPKTPKPETKNDSAKGREETKPGDTGSKPAETTSRTENQEGNRLPKNADQVGGDSGTQLGSKESNGGQSTPQPVNDQGATAGNNNGN
ncbi:MAG: hypothetical protein OXD32_01920 [Endozoicomonadaceae bacterium]|nr:hypothetical protein [Endozoicomonadaceae bacterium]